MNAIPRLAGALCALLLAAPAAVLGQAYPSKPIRFIVPNPPGGGTDTLTRVIANKLNETLQWQIVVDNRPGAGGNVGLDAAAKSAPDGYTIAMGESSNLAINPALYAKLPYDPARDFAPIALIGSVPLVLVVAPNRPLDSIAAAAAAAKVKPLAFASAGNGTVGHLVGELWKRAAGVELLHVPYKGAAPAMTDLMGGQVDLFFASLPAAAPLIKAGKLRALAVTSAQRAPSLPDVPTLAESGYRDFSAGAWYGVLVPAGTPAAIVARLNAEINRALQAPDMRTRLANDGVDARGGTPEEFAAFLEGERVKWARAVRDSGAKID
ncbi:MAG: tripartite tricarboxylate transporter substrate binding protein [Betaproteobacteria bacterium]|nr:tripartite tricarboxylate transporter substrate binding protein [Betaproteobacteria bacterium]